MRLLGEKKERLQANTSCVALNTRVYIELRL